MKSKILIIIAIVLFASCNTQQNDIEGKKNKTANSIKNDFQNNYSLSMKEYELGNYHKSSEIFQKIIDSNTYDDISTTELYNGACVFALADKKERAINILNYLASNRFYSNYKHITSDTDLNNIHSDPKWEILTEKVAENKKTEPERLRKRIKTELFKAKKILLTDNGKLWGENIWNDDILVLDFDNTIYTIIPLQNSKTNDSVIYYKRIPENTLGFSCSTQKYKGKEHAVVLTNYLYDNSATIIHELFHILQHKHINLNGNPIQYLDNYDAREWLRLEYQSLRNALNAINQNKEKSEIVKFVGDALLFRKIRQSKYKEYLQKEIEIETSEGLANYTGFILSSNPNKYEMAISEINQREQAQTYTRPFPYATGPAYGLIFDYLKINWKTGLGTTYNFLKIYETKYLDNEISISSERIKNAQQRNNFTEIHKQELDRKINNEKILDYYTDIFLKKPTLTVKLTDSLYGRTFDMNSTIILKDRGIVYSMLKGVDGSGNNFGNFTTIKGKEKLGVSGVLYSFDGTKYIFPLPVKIEENRIIGDYYIIELNDGWEVKKIDEKGNMKIVKQRE
jgi:hypothetical protein